MLGWLLAATGCGDDVDQAASSTSGSSSDGGTTGSSSVTPTSMDTTASDSTLSTTATPTTDATTTTDGADTTDGGAASSSESTGAALCPDVGDPCTICESTQCPNEYCGCYDNGSCLLLAQCAAKCVIDDLACNQACWTQYPDGISDAGLLSHCAATICTAECGPYIPLTPCQVCLYSECADEMNVCIANPDCTDLLACLAVCDDPGCENTCYAAHPGGLADSGPVGECAQVACLQECA